MFQLAFILLVLGAPIYFFWRWLFRKKIADADRRQWVTWLTTLVSTPVIYAVLVLALFWCINYYPKKEFERKAWLADQETRYQMSGDIIESKMLIGKTKAEVKALLGEGYSGDNSDYWSYYLGFVPEIANIDPNVLDITFKNGKVVEVTQHNT